MSQLVNGFIIWAIKRTKRLHRKREVVRFDRSHLFWRHEFLWWDEGTRMKEGKRVHYNRPPWYRPFGILLHKWDPEGDNAEGFHDHPRWSITICLKGQITEITPWARRVLRPGSIVIRSRKYIHAFEIEKGYRNRTWTLFIVGRRNHPQNTYIVTPQGMV